MKDRQSNDTFALQVFEKGAQLLVLEFLFGTFAFQELTQGIGKLGQDEGGKIQVDLGNELQLALEKLRPEKPKLRRVESDRIRFPISQLSSVGERN